MFNKVVMYLVMGRMQVFSLDRLKGFNYYLLRQYVHAPQLRQHTKREKSAPTVSQNCDIPRKLQV